MLRRPAIDANNRSSGALAQVSGMPLGRAEGRSQPRRIAADTEVIRTPERRRFPAQAAAGTHGGRRLGGLFQGVDRLRRCRHHRDDGDGGAADPSVR